MCADADHPRGGRGVAVATDLPPVPARKRALSLLEAGIDAAYQPIVHLGSGAVIAYEALARPRHRQVSGPLEFFAVLEQAGLRLQGERMAFEAALRDTAPDPWIAGARGGDSHNFGDGHREAMAMRAGTVVRRTKLFVNASPLTLIDPEFDVLELIHLADEHGISATDLVVEVTESEAVDDLDSLAVRTRRLRRLGVGVAVDDAGAGHASFRVITRLRPSWIKLDRDLISGVDTDGARHAFIEAMVRFARQIGSRLIAEGIETEGELASLAGLGVEAGQGHFLAHPQLGAFVSPSQESRRVLARAAQRLHLGDALVAVSELVRPPVFVDPATPVSEVHARFTAAPALSLMFLREERGLSQVTRRVLERLLAAPGGWGRLGHREIREVADHEPPTVVAHLDVREVGAILAAQRTGDSVDDVVVTDAHGALLGVAATRDLLRVLTEVRPKTEHDLHPLSGLLGPGWVEAELARRLNRDEAVTVAVLDVDAFRTINQLGGFPLGDEVIRTLARSLTGVAASVLDAAAAHIGGDDFVLLVPPRGFSELLAAVVRAFESEVMPVVRTELRMHDAEHLMAALGMSVAAIDLTGEPPPGRRYLEWARESLAQLAQTAKGEPGYSSAHRSGADVTLSTWTPRIGGQRTVALGMVEPDLVLRAIALVEREVGRWQAHAAERGDLPPDRFPGPRDVVLRLWGTYAEPLRVAARAARDEGAPLMDVALRGEEDEVLALLDRVALVTSSLWSNPTVPVPPELSLLDRFLRQRSRSIVRTDVVTRR